MHRNKYAVIAALFVIATLVACAPKPAPPPEQPPAPTTEPTAGPAPVSTEASAAAPVAVAPTAVPMEVGSTMTYLGHIILVAVPGGSFIMGGTANDNKPTHTVTVNDLWIYKYEVTNRMYQLCVSMGKCSPPDPTDNPKFDDVRQGNKPVVGVNWQQAVDYCTWVKGRLPTEAEWEYTARGPNSLTYPWGNTPAPTCDLLNFGQCVRETTNVGTYPKGGSYFTAEDMSGNAFEWVSDWYSPTYYTAAAVDNPQGPASGTKRSIRSSAFNSDGFLTEASRRFFANPQDHRADLGFRCVVEDPGVFAPFCTQMVMYGKNAPGGSGAGEDLKQTCSCPDVDVSEIDCSSTYVFVGQDNLSSTSGVEACTPSGSVPHGGGTADLYICHPGPGQASSVTGEGTCDDPTPSAFGCNAGYTQEGDLCVIDHGTTGICPDGSTYDEAAQCCSVTTGSGASYQRCPPGYWEMPGHPNSCVDFEAGPSACPPVDITYKTNCGGSQPNCEDHPEDPRCQPGGCPPNTPGCGPTTGCTPNSPNWPYCN